jgi:nucleotide-binding universal stress UspA family protein
VYDEILIANARGAAGRDGVAFADAVRTSETTVAFADHLVARVTVARLHSLASRRATDLLIVGSDLARAAVRDAPCQVAVTPLGYAEREDRSIHSIGIGHTDTPEGRAVLDAARELAWSLGADIHAVRVVSRSNWPTLESSGGWRLVAANRRLGEIPGVQGFAVEGDTERALARFAHAVDLLVIGAHHHGVVRRLVVGDIASSLTNHIPCPLLVVPP